MKTRMTLVSVFTIVGMLMATAAFAGDKTKSTTTDQTGMEQTRQTGLEQNQSTQSYIRGSQLIGKNAVSRNNEELGNIEDVVFGKDGQANFLVISHGEVLGMGGNLIPVPFSAIDQGSASSEDNIVLNVDEQELKDAPSFADNEWPDFSDSQYEQQVQGYFGGTPSSESGSSMEMHKMDTKTGYDKGEIDTKTGYDERKKDFPESTGSEKSWPKTTE